MIFIIGHVQRYLGNQILNDPERSDKKLGSFFRFAIGFVRLQPILPLLQHLTSRHSLRYWPNYFLPRYVYDFPLFAILYACLDFYFDYFAIALTILTLFPVCSYILLTKFHLYVLQQTIKTNRKLTLLTAIQLLRQIFLVNRYTNECISSLILPMISFFAGTFLILCMAFVIQTYAGLHLVFIFNVTIAIVLLLLFLQIFYDDGGKIHTYSGNLKQMLCKRFKGRTCKRIVETLPQLKLHVGCFFHIEKVSFMIFCDLLIVHTNNLMLTNILR